MLRVRILPYRMTSENGALAERLNALRVYPDRNYRPRESDLLVVWGYSGPVRFNLDIPAKVLNPPAVIARKKDKRDAFALMESASVRIPTVTADKETAKAWTAQRRIVLCRTSVAAQGGSGIHIARTPAEVIDAPLYVLYLKKEHEYRVHVFQGRVIDVTEKRRASGNEPALIRSYANGYVFARSNIAEPADLREQAIKAVRSLGLDFGAVDIVQSLNDGLCYVLEVNTAPGLEGTTLDRYVQAISAVASGPIYNA
jgi:glutathione synthase/RimK-type ligase-like ATP-grasp enzyme